MRRRIEEQGDIEHAIAAQFQLIGLVVAADILAAAGDIKGGLAIFREKAGVDHRAIGPVTIFAKLGRFGLAEGTQHPGIDPADCSTSPDRSCLESWPDKAAATDKAIPWAIATGIRVPAIRPGWRARSGMHAAGIILRPRPRTARQGAVGLRAAAASQQQGQTAPRQGKRYAPAASSLEAALPLDCWNRGFRYDRFGRKRRSDA